MAALTKDRSTSIKAGGTARTRVGEVAAATKIYKGALIAKNAAGHVVPASDTAALKVLGIAEEQVDNSAGAAAAKTCSYITGVEVDLVNAGGAIVQAGKGALCYVSDDNGVTTAAVAANDVIAGQVVSFTAALVQVFVDEAFGQVA